MKKKALITLVSLVLFFFNHTLVSAKNSYFDDGKKLFDDKNYKDSKFYFEKDIVFNPKSEILYQLQGGLRSSMGYIGAKKITEIQKKARFVKITKAGFDESMVHSVEMTKDKKKI